MIIVSLLDNVSEKYSALLSFENVECARRWFVSNLKSLLKNPNAPRTIDDYVLFFVGEWDDVQGTFIKLNCPKTPKSVGVLVDDILVTHLSAKHITSDELYNGVQEAPVEEVRNG